MKKEQYHCEYYLPRQTPASVQADMKSEPSKKEGAFSVFQDTEGCCILSLW